MAVAYRSSSVTWDTGTGLEPSSAADGYLTRAECEAR